MKRGCVNTMRDDLLVLVLFSSRSLESGVLLAPAAVGILSGLLLAVFVSVLLAAIGSGAEIHTSLI